MDYDSCSCDFMQDGQKGQTNMTIEVKHEPDSLTILLQGRLDTVTAPELEEVLDQELPGVRNLIFDLQGLDYTSSAGLRLFLKAQKIMLKQGGMTLKHVAPGVMEVFEITGFSDILTVE